MTVKLLTKQHLEFLSLTGGCTDSSESTLVKMQHCWKSHVVAQMFLFLLIVRVEKAFHWRADGCPTLMDGWVALCFSRGSSISLFLRTPIFQGGSPPLDPRMQLSQTPSLDQFHNVNPLIHFLSYTPIPHRPRIPRIDTNWQIFGFVAESFSVREGLNWFAQSVVSSCNS